MSEEWALQPAIRSYIDEVFALLLTHALRRDAVDSVALRAEAEDRLRATATIPETYPTIRLLLERLGDHHSYFITPDDAESAADKHPQTPPSGHLITMETVESTAATRSETLPLGNHVAPETVKNATTRSEIPPSGHLIAYIAVPSIDGDGATAQSYAEQMQTLIRTFDTGGSAGWVVDLRGNTGGNMWPMLAGLGPLLGDGELGAFVYPDGATESWEYRAGKATLDGWPMLTIASPHTLAHAAPPIAILQEARTRSSGELVALAFHGVPHTRTFGMPTAGVPTANAPFLLSDGAVIMLTVARGADRLGNAFDAPLGPDHPIPQDDVYEATDHAMQAASSWLASVLSDE